MVSVIVFFLFIELFDLPYGLNQLPLGLLQTLYQFKQQGYLLWSAS